MSRSNLHRLVKKQKEELLRSAALALPVNIENDSDNVYPSEIVTDLNYSASSYSLNNNTELNNAFLENEEKPSQRQKLLDWYHNNNVTRDQLDALLKILESENLDVPLSANGLLNLNLPKAVIRTVRPCHYTHIGIRNYLEFIKNKLPDNSEIILDVNVDGLPLFKSSNTSLWPILGHFPNIPSSDVFLIGSYVGSRKPANVDDYMNDFVSELVKFV